MEHNGQGTAHEQGQRLLSEQREKTESINGNDIKQQNLSEDSTGLMSDHDEEKIDGVHKRATNQSQKSSVRERVRQAEGWRKCVAYSALGTLAILILNLVVTIWSAKHYGTVDGVGVGYEGSCRTVAYWEIGLKVAINVLSSALLSMSNYTMQCLSSPTRADLDRAHEAGDWMDIGVSGFRNLFRVRKWRVILWVFLAISSVPIHLFYNSTILKSLSANEYSVVVTSDRFLDARPFQHRYWLNDPASSGSKSRSMTRSQVAEVESIHQKYLSNKTAFSQLDNHQCIDKYNTGTLAGHSNVIVVADYNPSIANQSVLYFDSITYAYQNKLPFAWICHDSGDNSTGTNPVICNAALLANKADTWQINGKSIKYCLAEIAPSFCKLEFCVPMLIAVILCNAIKSIAMLMAIWTHKEAILTTTGDAVASYLSFPDELTKNRCLLSIRDVRHEPYPWSAFLAKSAWLQMPAVPREVRPNKRRWFGGASKKRWWMTCVFVVSSCTVVGVFLGIGVTGLADRTGNDTAPWTIGFGQVNTQALIGAKLPAQGASRIVSAVILANLPQMILSFIYLGYNGLFTCMFLAAEWNQYSEKRKVLRVSSPRGQQKGTRFLTLPYRFSIPLLIGSTSLHFLLSESIYLVRFVVYKGNTAVPSKSVTNLGYSPNAMATVIGLGVYILLLALAVGTKRLHGFMPVAGSCSVAIAAACHPPEDEKDAALFPLMWGEVVQEGEVKATDVRHCTFTSREVVPVTVGYRYAGRRNSDSE